MATNSGQSPQVVMGHRGWIPQSFRIFRTAIDSQSWLQELLMSRLQRYTVRG